MGKIVVQMDKEFNIVAMFPSFATVAKAIGVCANTIRYAIEHESVAKGGFYWENVW